jgi:hypothetical protein
MAVLDGLGDIPGKINELGQSLAPLTGFAGFMYGVTAKWKDYHTESGYPFSADGVKDMIAQIFGRGAVKVIDPKWSGAADRTLNIGAVLNKGTFAAIGVYALKEILPNKYTRILYNVAFPPLVGYGIGRVFDDSYNLGMASTFGQAASTGTWLPQVSKGAWA